MTKRFKKIYIEITNQCNFNCNFCPRTTREAKEMSVIDFKNIAEQVKEFTDVVCLHVVGEPTLHTRFGEILSICQQVGLGVELVTNGSVILDKEFRKDLRNSLRNYTINDAAALDKICFSLNAYDDLTNQQIEDFCLFAISASIVNKTVEFRFFEKNSLYKKMKAWFEQYLGKVIESDKILSNVYFRFINKFLWPEQTAETVGQERTSCLGGKTHIAILSNAQVVPCCLDSNGKLPLGNILTTPLKHMLESEKFKDFINGFRIKKPKFELCKTCKFYKK
ncbi:MAG: radical SAM protein [Firmicutes bacterium]|nr:radical SAM protein [Bacillota bacterium]